VDGQVAVAAHHDVRLFLVVCNAVRLFVRQRAVDTVFLATFFMTCSITSWRWYRKCAGHGPGSSAGYINRRRGRTSVSTQSRQALGLLEPRSIADLPKPHLTSEQERTVGQSNALRFISRADEALARPTRSLTRSRRSFRLPRDRSRVPWPHCRQHCLMGRVPVRTAAFVTAMGVIHRASSLLGRRRNAGSSSLREWKRITS
jgi:hypothetical protein